MDFDFEMYFDIDFEMDFDIDFEFQFDTGDNEFQDNDWNLNVVDVNQSLYSHIHHYYGFLFSIKRLDQTLNCP